MVRLLKSPNQTLVLLCAAAFATFVRAQFYPVFRNSAELFRLSKCAYRSTQYNAGDLVKTGEPCLNCTCSNGAIVCHLRVCTPIPDPPPSGCFIVHKRHTCCPELVCNDDNNISFDGLEGRSRPGASEEAEAGLENVMKFNRRGCVINGTTYADGSALSSSTDCKYCFCLKGKEECVKPNCILELPGCTPIFSKYVCCPVRYNCYDSDNVTIISTQLSLTTRKTTPPFRLTEILASHNKSHTITDETKPTTKMMSTTRMMSNEVEITSNHGPRENTEAFSLPIKNEYKQTSTPLAAQTMALDSSRYTSLSTEPGKTSEYSTAETVTEISTSISLVNSKLTVEDVDEGMSSTAEVEERKNTFPQNDGIISESTQAYDRSSKENFTKQVEPVVTLKAMSPEIEAILNITKKKQEGDYELDYDEPTLPPSLPNLKIIPFVAADALDKPKDVTIEHRADLSAPIEVTASILEAPVPESGQFSPPVKTEGGFVPRDPTLDGPYFESKYNNIYQHTTENKNIIPSEQLSLPSITESTKVVENGLCTIGYVTYRHGELISEPKACNMCLCLYGQIVCQKPECPPVKRGCQRLNYEDVNNCCGEIICYVFTISENDNTTEPVFSSTEEGDKQHSEVHNANLTTAEPTVTQPSVNPTYMTIKVKSTKNETKIHTYTSKSTRVTSNISQLTTSQSFTTPSNEKSDIDYDSGFSFNNMLSFLFDEIPLPQKLKNFTKSTEEPLIHSTTTPTTTSQTTPTTPVQLLTSRTTSKSSVESVKNISNDTVSPKPDKAETDSAIYVIKKEDTQYSKNAVNYTDEQINSIQQVNSYYVPPLGNFEEVILNPTEKPPSGNKKPTKIHNAYISTTLRPRYTTAKVMPLSRPMEKSRPQLIAGDPGAASGLLKLSGCNIFGRMYRLGKIISELSSPCLQCMCAEIGVHCVPLKC